MVIPFITENIYFLHNDQLINSFFLVQKLFKFHKVKIVHCCIYSWMTGALFRKSLPNTEVYFLLFLLEVLDLSLRSMIHLALICVQVEREESNFLLYVYSQISQYNLFKQLSFLQGMFLVSVRNQGVVCVIIPGSSVLFH